ncbi:MAG: hypothetical protein O7B35_09320 [Deltaproteobacteria bacterium]|nr:hypothetical protein [Deltaproteobacteria bacterium]
MKRIGSLVLVGIAAVVLMGQARPNKVAKVIEAEKFVLRDANGKARAELGVYERGVARLTFKGKDGNSSLVLSVDNELEISGLVIDQGNYNISILSTIGSGFLSVSDKEFGEIVTLSVSKDSTSFIINDTSRNTRLVLGNTSLETTDTGTKTRTAESSLVLFDKKGKVIWKAP